MQKEARVSVCCSMLEIRKKSSLFYYQCEVENYMDQSSFLLFDKHEYTIVGRGGRGHTPLFYINPPFSKIPPFLEILDVPTFQWFIRKTKVLNNSCNWFVYNFYPQSFLVLEECLKKWWKTWYNAFMKRDCQLEKGIWNSYLKLSPT